MPNVRNWIELEEGCFGPDQDEDGSWSLILFIRRCRAYERHDGTPVVQRPRGTVVLQGSSEEEVREQLDRFIERPDVVYECPADSVPSVARSEPR